MANLDPRQRQSAAALAARRLAPGPEARFAGRWQVNCLQVWVPTEAVPDTAQDDEILIAESSLLPPPAAPDTERLVRVLRGVEGQAWRSGILVASRWWPEGPSRDAWVQFLRAASIQGAHASAVPEIETLPLAKAPWGQPLQRLAWSAAQLESAFWRALLLACGLVVGWNIAASLAWGAADLAQAHELESLRQDAAPLIAARERAEAARDRLVAFEGLGKAPVDYQLMADVRERLPADIRIASWVRDAGTLRIEVLAPEADPRVLVRAFEGHPLLAGVVANPMDGGRMQLDVDLDGEALDQNSPQETNP